MFNKSKPYGEVCGPNVPYKYEQDGRYYDQQFNEVTDKGELIARHVTAEEQRETIKTVATTAPPADDVVIDESGPVPEIGMDLAASADAFVDDLDELKLPEIKEQLDRLGVKYDKNARKADLKALLADELIAAEIEKDQEEHEGEE